MAHPKSPKEMIKIFDKFADSYDKEPKDGTGSRIIRAGAAQSGRSLNNRNILFTTSKYTSPVVNVNEAGTDWGDVTCKIYAANGDEITSTLNEGGAVKTVLDFGPAYSYEIIGGELFVPSTLAGADDALWKLHVIGAPVLADVRFVTNKYLKFLKGTKYVLDGRAAKNLIYIAAAPLANTIRIIATHPAGAQSEFLLSLDIFR